jgi:Phosphotransferase enzyme family
MTLASPPQSVPWAAPEIADGPPLAARALRVVSWLTNDDLNDPRLKIESLSRFHVVSRVWAPDGRIAVVKHPADRTAGDGRNLARELFVYRLARWKPSLASVLPMPILVDEERQILAVEHAGDPSAQWPLQFAPHPVTYPGIAARLGAAMAGWHADTRQLSLLPSLSAGVLYLSEDIDAATAGRSAMAARFMRFMVDDQAFRAVLDEGRALYRPLCLIHGDIRGDNWVLCGELKLIDWEMSGAGDPAWDVASVLAEIVLQAVRDGADFAPEEHGWPQAVERLAPIFTDAYCPADDRVEMRERLVPFTAARLLHVASEWVEAGSRFAHDDAGFDATGVTPILEIVRALLGSRTDATRRLSQWIR